MLCYTAYKYLIKLTTKFNDNIKINTSIKNNNQPLKISVLIILSRCIIKQMKIRVDEVAGQHAACDVSTRNVLKHFFTTLRVSGDAFTICDHTGCRRHVDTFLRSISRRVKASLGT